jgi:hypothetical protein
MSTRKKTPVDFEAEVLLRSRRRCCLCFGLNFDDGLKKGQIAHLDRNPGNAMLDNLAFLCLDHHDVYDSRTCQSKGLAIVEVKAYRELLHSHIQGLLLQAFPSNSVSQKDWEEALRFHISPHRNKSVVLTVEKHAKTLEEINDQVPPKDIEWTKIILDSVVSFGWIRCIPTDFLRYELTMNGRHMLDVLKHIPEKVKRDAWNEIWDLKNLVANDGHAPEIGP